MRIAILGWGSLLWEDSPEFDRWHAPWAYDGPILKIEFSRISKSRSGALTLVIDDKHGTPTTVAWCLSKRATVDDAVCDLRCREGTTLGNIGRMNVPAQAAGPKGNEQGNPIVAWAQAKNIDSVVWTALKPNFQNQKQGRPPFSVAAAIAYLKTLDAASKAKAAEYVWRTCTFVKTDLRSALQREPWFSEESR